ncbi:4908_t:CDS:1, partial [Gigaspora rosea]
IGRKKAEQRKELNIIIPMDRKVLIQEFSHIAYLSPSIKRDEAAKKLIYMKK